jgi:hypothetical protein
MITPGSRYENAVAFQEDATEAVPASPGFRGLRPRAIGPAKPVIEHALREGERHDALAVLYYNEPRLWWRILDANPDVLYAGDLIERAAGETLLIPRAAEPG